MKTVADFDSLNSVDILAQAAETDELSGGMNHRNWEGSPARRAPASVEKRSRFLATAGPRKRMKSRWTSK
jgi:hypothetical protein